MGAHKTRSGGRVTAYEPAENTSFGSLSVSLVLHFETPQQGISDPLEASMQGICEAVCEHLRLRGIALKGFSDGRFRIEVNPLRPPKVRR